MKNALHSALAALSHVRACDASQLQNRSMPYGIVDKVMVPADLAAGDYILSLRVDVEQIPTIFSQCADVSDDL